MKFAYNALSLAERACSMRVFSSDTTRAFIGGKSVLYESIEYRAELKLSRHLPNCTMFRLFRDFFIAFFR